jgi:hypothetical protein
MVTVQVEGLETESKLVAEVLAAHKVFGDFGPDYKAPSWQEDFVRAVTQHATEEKVWSYLELTYPSCVRLIIKTQVVEGEASIRSIEAFDHPHENPKMDYEALNADIQAVVG